MTDWNWNPKALIPSLVFSLPRTHQDSILFMTRSLGGNQAVLDRGLESTWDSLLQIRMCLPLRELLLPFTFISVYDRKYLQEDSMDVNSGFQSCQFKNSGTSMHLQNSGTSMQPQNSGTSRHLQNPQLQGYK